MKPAAFDFPKEKNKDQPLELRTLFAVFADVP